MSWQFMNYINKKRNTILCKHYVNIQREIILFIYYLLSDCFENLANNLSIGATATKNPALPWLGWVGGWASITKTKTKRLELVFYSGEKIFTKTKTLTNFYWTIRLRISMNTIQRRYNIMSSTISNLFNWMTSTNSNSLSITSYSCSNPGRWIFKN